MSGAVPKPQPPDLRESLRRQWAEFGAWGYERHSRWGDETLTSPASWAATTALTITALILFIIGLERHAAFWDWMPGHRQAFFVLQSISGLGLGLLCLWLLAVRPLSQRSAKLAAAAIVVLSIAGLALLCDRANDALMATGATLLLVIAWRLTAMTTWGPHIITDLAAQVRRLERPAVPSVAVSPAVAAPPVPTPAADMDAPLAPEAKDTAPQPETPPGGLTRPALPAAVQRRPDAWLAAALGGLVMFIAAFTLPMLSLSIDVLSETSSADATLFDLARFERTLGEGAAGATQLAWEFGWGTILLAAFVGVTGAVGWLNLVAIPRIGLTILLIAGIVFLAIELIGVVLLTVELEWGGGVIVGTGGFWINLLAFVAIVWSLRRLRARAV